MEGRYHYEFHTIYYAALLLIKIFMPAYLHVEIFFVKVMIIGILYTT